jgi:hypothetical protein
MDHQTFDRLTRVVAASGSRRTAWRALLGGVLLGATTRGVAAGPCRTEKNPQCRCGDNRKCPPGKCFVLEEGDCRDPTSPDCVCRDEVCCSGAEPTSGEELIICGNRCCRATLNRDPIDDPCKNCDPPRVPPDCPGALAGSYRRR